VSAAMLDVVAGRDVVPTATLPGDRNHGIDRFGCASALPIAVPRGGHPYAVPAVWHGAGRWIGDRLSRAGTQGRASRLRSLGRPACRLGSAAPADVGLARRARRPTVGPGTRHASPTVPLHVRSRRGRP
jgi:hypothetical protein